MLDQLLNLVKESAQDAIVNNPAVPNQHNDGVIREATSSITNGLQKELANGGFQNVLKTLSGQHGGDLQNNSVVQNISGGFISNIMDKFGLDSSTAKEIASSLIPMVMNKLIHKTNDPNDSSFDLGSIFSSLTGGRTSGMDLGGILKSVTSGGLDKNGDGRLNLGDVTSLISGAAQGEQAKAGSGGEVMGALKGLFGG